MTEAGIATVPEASVRLITVIFISNGMKTVSAPENSNLLRISLREGGGIPFKCGGGLCGTCKCRIEAGLEHTDAVKPKERKHLSEADIARGYRMACQTFVRGHIEVSWAARDPSAPAFGGASTAREQHGS
ncbi:MAG: 2Fe-2S iron-sulfur cluster-binding protein [Acetobacteraceae bacterium]